MTLSERPAASLKLVGGRPCLDFVNTVGGRRSVAAGKKDAVDYLVREDKLADYFDLLAWSLRAGLLTDSAVNRLEREARRQPSAAKAVLERAVALREAIYRIFVAVVGRAAPRPADLDLLNRELAVAHGRVRLAVGEESGFVWEWTDTKNSLDQMLWLIADSAAEILTAGDLTRLRQCGGEDCGWIFEDTTRNRSRQWCDMQDCGNLAKVRRFRTRLRG